MKLLRNVNVIGPENSLSILISISKIQKIARVTLIYIKSLNGSTILLASWFNDYFFLSKNIFVKLNSFYKISANWTIKINIWKVKNATFSQFHALNFSNGFSTDQPWRQEGSADDAILAKKPAGSLY